MYRLICLLISVLFASSFFPTPASIAAHGYADDEQDASTTAYELSLLEAAGSFDELYDRMHPDAQAIIPREAVVGWYENEFAPREPQPITVTGVQEVTWVWPVTGASYEDTAEVSFEQPFGDGTVVSDVIRLVQDDTGVWRWFFGRSADFVEEQIALYANEEEAKTDSDTAPRPLGEASSSTCELVELYPGYPGYRGYITGLVGAGDHKCLSDLEAMDPTFSRSREDEANLQAARSLGISGSMEVWIWENWMAIEGERDLPPTCYSCLLFDTSQFPEPNGAYLDPNDPRLLVGTSLSYLTYDTTAMRRELEDNGFSTSTFYGFTSDQHLRALTGLLYGGRPLNAIEMLEAYGVVVNALTDIWLDIGPPNRVLLDYGGYLPTPGTANPAVQIFMFLTGFEALGSFMDPNEL